MPTETLNLQVNEKGARVVKRNIDAIGTSSTIAGKKVTNFQKNLSLLGGTVGVLQNIRRNLGGIGAIIATTFSVNLLRNFSQEMSTVQAVTNATEEEFESLRKEAERLGSTTRFTATQAAEGMTFLARAGFETNEVLQTVEGTLRLAQAGALDLGSAADIASNVLQGFRLSVDQTGRVVDVMAKTANSANTNVLQLGGAMSFVAPVAAGLGVSIEETAAAIGALSNAGIQGERAGTGLRRVLAELETPGTTLQKIFKELGIDQEDVRITSVGLTQALSVLRDAGIDVGQALEGFGQRGGPAFEVLTQAIDSSGNLPITGALQDAGGTAQKVADIMDDNLNGAVLSMVSAFQGLIIELGNVGAFSLLESLFRGLAEAFRFLTRNAKELTIALGALFTIIAANKIAPALASFLNYSKAIASGAVVVLGSAEAERQKAVAVAQGAQSQLAAAEANVVSARTEASLAASKVKSITATRAQLVADRELLLSHHRHIISTSGRTKSLTKLAEVRRAEIAITRILTREETLYTAAQGRATAADVARSTAVNNLTRAKTIESATTAAASGTTTRFGQALLFVRVQTKSLFALIARHPIGALVIAIGTIVLALTKFRNEIKVTNTGLATLGDLFSVISDSVVSFVKSAINSLGVFLGFMDNEFFDTISNVFTSITSVTFADFIRGIAFFVDTVAGAFNGLGSVIGVAIAGIAVRISDGFRNAINNALRFVEAGVNSIIGIINELSGAELFDNINLEIPDDIVRTTQSLGADIADAWIEGSRVTFAQDWLSDQIIEAEDRARDRLGLVDVGTIFEIPEPNIPNVNPLGEGPNADFQKILADLEARNAILRRGYEDRKAGLQILELERELEIQLTDAQRESVLALQKENEQLQNRADILDSILDPQEQFKTSLQSINELLDEGSISLAQSNAAILSQVQTVYQASIDSTNDFVEAYKTSLQLIDDARQDDLINEENYQIARAELTRVYNEQRLSYASDFFGNLATLSQSENKKLAVVGKAAAITQATIDGVLGVQKALASAPPPVNFALAAAVGVAAAANVAKIATARALGGDLNAGQLSTVGEASFGRDEVFTGVSGKQTFLPSERGRVEPLKSSSGPAAAAAPQINVPPARIQIILVKTEDEAKEYLESDDGQQSVLRIISNNPEEVSAATANE